ncbi:hypothetical protein BC940DRAFT_298725 [Gongronella butleri]|nr:hypothetical protein BC940DRAFT_298725 [Gongronella butleri]
MHSSSATRPSIYDETKRHTFLPDLRGHETGEPIASHWRIKHWSKLQARTHGPVLKLGGHTWRLLLYPKGNGVRDCMSLYLEVVHDNNGNHQAATNDWAVCAQFCLVLSDPTNPSHYFDNCTTHRFCPDEIDWGFTRFYDLKMLEKNRLVVDDAVTISVFVRIVKDPTGVLWRNLANYDSRKETGYVGLKNQGATCYMNSLLQSLFCINQFRKAVYQVPVSNGSDHGGGASNHGGDASTKNVGLALQKLFYQLEHANEPVSTTELTKSFGWETVDGFMQHDVQEFSRVLLENLEAKMKNTPADGAIESLFVGKMKSYIKCIDVNYESSRVEDFYDIQLNVVDCKNVQASFDQYIEEETMDGENQYMAEGHGLQNARKGVIFERFPPVLHLHLKRFHYSANDNVMVKINDRYEFPDTLCLRDYCTDRSQDYTYQLHSVLVHSGDLHSGHYFAMINPHKERKWLKFDDEHVVPAANTEVFDDNFGLSMPAKHALASHPGTGIPKFAETSKSFTNAYMLVYIQKDKIDQLLHPLADTDIPAHLRLGSKELSKKCFIM